MNELCHVDARSVRDRIKRGNEIAFLDVRDEALYSQRQAFGSISIPFNVLEARICSLIPRRTVPVVILEEDEQLVNRAAVVLRRIGYTDVALLKGGLESWTAAGGEIFFDVNVPSKAFGEWVATRKHTPHVTAERLRDLLDSGDDVLLLDVRPAHEFRTMSIPTARNAPGVDLLYRVHDLIRSPETKIVVNCAGRTRSIIAAQSLIDAGIRNPVAALMNGTIGWTLAGLPLEHGSRHEAPLPTEAALAKARSMAAMLAERAEVDLVDWPALQRLREDRDRTLFEFDVRSPAEYTTGHLPGFSSAPGGQLIQALDEYVGVRGARIVLADNDGVRARVTASWLKQMGWREVYVLSVDLATREQATGMANSPALEPVLPSDYLTPSEAQEFLTAGAVGIDLAPSSIHREGHIPGVWFLVRSRAQDDVARLPHPFDRAVLTSSDGVIASHAAAEMAAALPGVSVKVLKGGTAAWRRAGLPLEKAMRNIASEPTDVYKRPYEGTDNSIRAMQAYIDWELQLVEQIERDGMADYRLL